jgi:hypothetical protein
VKPAGNLTNKNADLPHIARCGPGTMRAILSELLALRSSVKTVWVADLLSLERYHQMTDGWGDEVIGLKQHPAGDYVKWRDVLKVCQSISAIEAPASEQEVVKIGYTNWRGEYAEREIVPMRPWFSATDWHPEPQWLLKAWDIAKGAERDFAIKDIGFKPTPQEAPIEVTEDAVFRAMTKADDLDIALCDDDAREILAAALKGDRH